MTYLSILSMSIFLIHVQTSIVCHARSISKARREKGDTDDIIEDSLSTHQRLTEKKVTMLTCPCLVVADAAI